MNIVEQNPNLEEILIKVATEVATNMGEEFNEVYHNSVKNLSNPIED